jgi:hypothetical protein
MIQA